MPTGEFSLRRRSNPRLFYKRNLDSLVDQAFLEGQGASNILSQSPVTVEMLSQAEERFASLSNRFQLQGSPGLTDALKAVFLFGASLRVLRDKYSQAADVATVGMVASVRCQRLLTTAFLDLKPEQGLQLMQSAKLSFRTQDEWVKIAIGAFSVARLMKAVRELGGSAELVSEYYDMFGIDLLVQFSLRHPLALQVGTRSGIKSSRYYFRNQMEELGQADGWVERKGRRLVQATRKFKLYGCVPVLVEVCHNALAMIQTDYDMLELVTNLLQEVGTYRRLSRLHRRVF